MRSENLGDKIGVTYHQAVNKEVAVAISIDQAGDKVRNYYHISPSLAIHDFDLMPGCTMPCVHVGSLAY